MHAVAVGDGGLQSVDVRPQEPWEGFEVDEVHGGGGRWVAEDDAHSTTFLAVADYRALGMQDRLLEGNLGMHRLLGDGKIELPGRRQAIAAREAIVLFEFGRSF